MSRSLIAALLALVALPGPAAAAPGELDPTFSAPADLADPLVHGVAHDALVHPEDGRIVVALQGPATSQALRLTRLLPDGAPDATFGNDPARPGVAELDVSANGSLQEVAYAVTRQPDGKYVVAGRVGHLLVAARFTADGLPDEGFDEGLDGSAPGAAVISLGQGNADAQAVGVDAEGRIVIAGSVDYDSRPLLARFGPTGVRDTGGFNDDDVETPAGTVALDVEEAERGWLNALAVEPDGGVTVAGTVDHGGPFRFMLTARVRSDGSPDDGYGEEGVREISIGNPLRDESAAAILRLPDGGYVVAGDAEGTAGTYDTALVKLTPGGRLDESFGRGDGISHFDLTEYDGANDVELLPDGRLLITGVAGDYNDLDLMVGRLRPDGTPDPGFGNGGFAIHQFPQETSGRAVGVQPSGGIVVAGLRHTDNDNTAFIVRLAGGDPPAASVPDAPEQPAVPGEPSSPPLAGRDTTAPVIGRVKLLRKRFRVARRATALAAAKRGTAFRFTLSEPATVRVMIGRRSLTRRLAAGAQRITFTGRIGTRRLKPGRKRAVLVATDAAGNSSKPRSVTFRITRR